MKMNLKQKKLAMTEFFLNSVLKFVLALFLIDLCLANGKTSNKYYGTNNEFNLYKRQSDINNVKNQNKKGYESPKKDQLNFNYANTRSIADDFNRDSCQLNIECNNNPQGQIRLPIYGPKGDTGPPGLPGPRGLKGEPGVDGIPARELPTPNFSAFFAALSNNTGPFTQDKDIVFKNVITNYGNNYDSETGYYTAPYSGIYQFLITISATGRQKAGVNLMKNKLSILTVWSESEPWSTSSQTVLLKLSFNDKVYLRLQARASHLHGYLYSSFGGNLLYELPV